MTVDLKPIYLGKCLTDLEKHYSEMPDCNGKKLRVLLTTANTLFKTAENYRREADEEQSYVFYMRYFHLIHMIRGNIDYSRNKQYVTEMLGGRARQEIAMEILTDITNSLTNRYKQLESKSSANNHKKMHNYSNNSSMLALESSLNSLNDKNDLNNSNNTNDYRINMLVTCNELFKMIQKQNPSESLLIMDCRSKSDFKKSRLHYASCLNVPQEILKNGMSAGQIQQELEDKSRALWSSRAIKDNIVLMDWDCKDADPPPDSDIFRLRNILRNWDPDIKYRSPIKILEGGFEKLILLYPTICTNSNVKNPTQIQSDFEALDDIEYPSIHDITMKDDTVFIGSTLNNHLSNYSYSSENQRVQQPPTIDRSSKLAAQRVYNEKKTGLDVVNEREALLNKAIQNEKTLLEAETQWKKVHQQVELGHDSDEQQNSLLAEKQNLLYKILQLENNERDFVSENERLKCELESARLREVNYHEKITEIEAENIKLAEKRIEEKIKIQQDIDEKREKEKLERMTIENSKEQQKRHLKPPSDDGISQPKIPQFDRSVKPMNRTTTNLLESIYTRDFSPIRGSLGRGLTGLKNLGNTCYMNSIMQCLSNTGTLTEYFVTNNYKTHVNRENKTKGKIVEEVAALVKVLWNGQYKCVASKDLRYAVGQYQQIFSGIEQQDSHEFLTILMDWLHSDLQTLQTSDSPRHDNLRAAEKSWLDFTKSCESYILQLFYGQIKSIVKCVSCSRESATYECFSNLSLELPPTTSRCQIDDCLNLYFNGEKIRGWNCPNCKQKRDAIKKLSISKLPPILVIHLKRFYADPDAISASTYRKKQNYVNFPLENLDMTPHIAKSETRSRAPKTYNLYSVSNHYGSMESGHYTAFCKSTVFNKWYKYDDQVVLNLDSSDVVSSAAYILFYTNLPLTSPSDV